MNIYWYVSNAKLDFLAEQSPSFLSGVKAKLGFNLGLLSGSLEGAQPARTMDDLHRVIKKLRSQNDIKDFSEIAEGDAPVLVSFDGPAMRQISNKVFWLSMESGSRALLLAGSPASAIGTPVVNDATFSPSADPVSAIKSVFSDGSPETGFGGAGMPDSTSLSYAWQTLMAQAAGGTLPNARGIAIFARSVKANRHQMSLIDKASVTELVIGSPIYVEQY